MEPPLDEKAGRATHGERNPSHAHLAVYVLHMNLMQRDNRLKEVEAALPPAGPTPALPPQPKREGRLRIPSPPPSDPSSPNPALASYRQHFNSLLTDISERVIKLDATGLEVRERFLTRLNALLASAFPGDHLIAEPFGSYAMGLSSPQGDMDIKLGGTVDLSRHPRSNGSAGDPPDPPPGTQLDVSRLTRGRSIDVLSNFHRALRRSRLPEVGRDTFPRAILHARVPISTFRDAQTGVDCDVSVLSDGVLKSQALGVVLSLDPRAASLVRLAKEWAKAYDINDASRGTLRSWAIALMCVTHLQVQEPPVLPPIKDLFDGQGMGGGGRPLVKGIIPTSAEVLDFMDGVKARAAAWTHALSQGSIPRNTASLEELVTSFFRRLHNDVTRYSAGDAGGRSLVGFDPWEGRLLRGQKGLVVMDPFVDDNCGSNLDPDRSPRPWRQVADACERAAKALTGTNLKIGSDGGKAAAAEVCVRVFGRSCIEALGAPPPPLTPAVIRPPPGKPNTKPTVITVPRVGAQVVGVAAGNGPQGAVPNGYRGGPVPPPPVPISHPAYPGGVFITPPVHQVPWMQQGMPMGGQMAQMPYPQAGPFVPPGYSMGYGGAGMGPIPYFPGGPVGPQGAPGPIYGPPGMVAHPMGSIAAPMSVAQGQSPGWPVNGGPPPGPPGDAPHSNGLPKGVVGHRSESAPSGSHGNQGHLNEAGGGAASRGRVLVVERPSGASTGGPEASVAHSTATQQQQQNSPRPQNGFAPSAGGRGGHGQSGGRGRGFVPNQPLANGPGPADPSASGDDQGQKKASRRDRYRPGRGRGGAFRPEA